MSESDSESWSDTDTSPFLLLVRNCFNMKAMKKVDNAQLENRRIIAKIEQLSSKALEKNKPSPCASNKNTVKIHTDDLVIAEINSCRPMIRSPLTRRNFAGDQILAV